MPTYIALLNWTDQGVRSFNETVDRYEAAQAQFEGLGVTFRDVFWTVGPYDIVGIVEAPDDETATASLLALGAQGNVRSTTLRAFGPEEMRGVIQKAG